MQPSLSTSHKEKLHYPHLLSGSLMVVGTAVGAGILGIPLVTYAAGFLPAALMTLLTCLFMIASGLLFLEATLWMPDGANILSITERFLGKKMKLFAGGMFAFLYYSLLTAYLAGGAPLLIHFFAALHIPLSTYGALFLFTLIFASIVALGAKSIDRANLLLSFCLVVTYVAMFIVGFPAVSFENLQAMHFPSMFFAMPVLFGAFGYHNVIPSLSTYLHRNKRVLRASIIIGCTLTCLICLCWEYLIMGIASGAELESALRQGATSVETLQRATGYTYLYHLGLGFALFAITTSLLGVSFSFVDFLADGFREAKWSASRPLLTLMTFVPPLLFTLYDPTLFIKALGVAGGFGESFLNGILPALIVWAGAYTFKMTRWFDGSLKRLFLIALIGTALFVVGIELVEMATHFYE